MKIKSDKPFQCTWCGEEHEMSLYVAAHWTTLIIHTCDVCGAKHDLYRGSLHRSKDGLKRLKQPKVKR